MTDKQTYRLLDDGWISEGFRCPLRLRYARQPSQDKTEDDYDPKRIQRAFLSESFLSSLGLSPQSEHISPEQIRQGTSGGWIQQPIHSSLGYTRIPLLFKVENEQWVIAQFQGRLWPLDQPVLRQGHLLKQKMKQYVVSLAYRVSCFQRAYPGVPVRAEFIFPSSGYFAKSPGVFDQAVTELGALTHGGKREDQNHECRDAFVRVSVDSAINELQTNGRWFGHYITSLGYHSETWLEWLAELESQVLQSSQAQESSYPFIPGRHCTQCRFRDVGSGKGCWSDQEDLPSKEDERSGRMHVFDLPGHGNESLVQDGVLFVDQLESQDSGDLPATFTIPWRREEQIRQETSHPNACKEAILPTLAESLNDLPRPFHFLDFEAVGFPLPQREGDRIYDPVLFQYSCHTWSGDVSLETPDLSHVGWLDEEGAADPEAVLVDHLVSNPALQEGTIIHFSPFEPQHLRKIAKRWAKNGAPKGFDKANNTLQAWMAKKEGRSFVDCLSLVRDGYHHALMQGKLGLKPLIGSLCASKEAVSPIASLSQKQMGFPASWLLEGHYEHSSVSDGETAMHSYLMIRMARKSGLKELGGITLRHPTQSHPELIQQMKQYCALDTFAMYLAFHHWLSVGEITVY